jgi:ABC-type transport system involved in multi-copper enzyme maturation permease subunit
MLAGLPFEDWVALVALGVVGVVAAAVVVWLLSGLFTARSLIRRELMAYFTSPIAYVVLVVFLFVTGYRFSLTLEQLSASGPEGTEYPMQLMFSVLPSSVEKVSIVELLSGVAFGLIYLLIPPLLTMRLFAEERSSGTLELLMTAPVRDWQVVLSKYIACLIFYMFLWLPTFAYLPVLLGMGTPVLEAVWTPFSIALLAGIVAIVISGILALLPGSSTMRLIALVLFVVGLGATAVGGWGHYHAVQLFGYTLGDGPLGDGAPHLLDIPVRIDPMPVVTTYLGLMLAGAMFLALGLLVSSMVRSQLVAALVSLVLSFVFVIAGIWRPEAAADNQLAAIVGPVLASLSVPVHFHHDFSRGLLDTRQVTLYASVAFFSLFLTVRSLESRRWR